MGYTKFKDFLLQNGIKQNFVAENILNIDKSVFSRKINKINDSKFTLDEVKKLCFYFKIKVEDYFF